MKTQNLDRDVPTQSQADGCGHRSDRGASVGPVAALARALGNSADAIHGGSDIYRAAELIESLRAQRDELAAALDEYVRVVQEVGCTEEWRKARLEQMAERDRAALAKLDGGK